MAAPKIVWEASRKETSQQDKKTIEALRERLNEKIQSDPRHAKKAALVLEGWLRKKPKP
jgi:hypothetical protein